MPTQVDVASWRIATVRYAGEFGRCRGIADSEQAAASAALTRGRRVIAAERVDIGFVFDREPMQRVDDLFLLLGRKVRLVRQGVKFGLDSPPERRANSSINQQLPAEP